ncbi:MAG TPA: dTMP kinase [Chloroflexi bacterium]|jgi:dTMP kinase|nr:dTMP kinase [Chloroflexota bacterium]
MFITFEGSEGSGKSTQINMLAAYLRQQGYEVLVTREPGGTHIGEQVRQCLHDVKNKEMTAAAEVLLYSASRSQLVREVIVPALENGVIVISDRYADSTMAYQGYGRQLDLDALGTITYFATGGLKPDLTILFDIDVEEGLSRRSIGGVEMNRMDLQEIAFYKRVRNGYMELVKQEPERWVIVDAGRPLDEIQNDVRRSVKAKLN